MRISIVLIISCLFAARGATAIPTTVLYPFPGYELTALRAKTKAETSPNSKELDEAWRLYAELRGSWMPNAPKPKAEAVADYNRLRAKLEALPKPPWYVEPAKSAHSGQSQLAEKIGDADFESQKSTPEYQAQKALALVYLTGHELDRPGDANAAGKSLTILTITHPWDWQIHNLYSRLLSDAQLPGPSWQAARFGLFLNPEPDLSDLKFFAYIGSIAAKDQWPQIQEAIRQAALDDKIAELAVVEMDKAYGSNVKVTNTPMKGK